MAPADPPDTDVCTAREIARAAGVSVADVRACLDAGEVPSVRGAYVLFDDAVELVRRLRLRERGEAVPQRLFAPTLLKPNPPRAPFAASGALHVALLVVLVLIASLGVRSDSPQARTEEPVRLVFLTSPGPGGGGGGGGRRQPAPAARARLKGRSTLQSPVVVRRPEVEEPARERPVEAPPPVPTPRPEPEEPPVAAPAPTPPVVAPVVSAASDDDDRAGVPVETPSTASSSGPGADDGAGSGTGGGLGEGDGRGIGPGTIAGTGGGPYRPGSGVTPPTLLREVKPVYTEEARQRGLEGDVLLEVVVTAAGRVGAISVVRGLGGGLDQRAIEAVRQWEFSPSRRFGTPVDVLVEVAVEFRLR